MSLQAKKTTNNLFQPERTDNYAMLLSDVASAEVPMYAKPFKNQHMTLGRFGNLHVFCTLKEPMTSQRSSATKQLGFGVP